MDISHMREEFVRNGLTREDLNHDPFAQFEIWFRQAEASGLHMPNSMSLATVSAEGQPSQRLVLLKFFDKTGFVFYTNYGSRKAREIAQNAKVALLFPWHDLDRQVRINGLAEKVSVSESAKYFLTRPRGSRLGAWVSNQSSVIASRQMLLSKLEEIKESFSNKEVGLPSFWGGYRVIPHAFEFWQGRRNRLHDRFLYTKTEATFAPTEERQNKLSHSWKIERLAP